MKPMIREIDFSLGYGIDACLCHLFHGSRGLPNIVHFRWRFDHSQVFDQTGAVGNPCTLSEEPMSSYPQTIPLALEMPRR